MPLNMATKVRGRVFPAHQVNHFSTCSILYDLENTAVYRARRTVPLPNNSCLFALDAKK